MAEFKKKQKEVLVLVAKPYYMEGETKVFVPIDKINSTPEWAVQSVVIGEETFSLNPVPQADGMECTFTIPDLPPSVIEETPLAGSYKCDADLGLGVSTLEVPFLITILPEMATGVDIEEKVVTP